MQSRLERLNGCAQPDLFHCVQSPLAYCVQLELPCCVIVRKLYCHVCAIARNGILCLIAVLRICFIARSLSITHSLLQRY